MKLQLDVQRPESAKDDWATQFERRIRDVASRAVAHIKRGDSVSVLTNGAGSVRADRNAGADPVLRFLALVEAVPAPASLPAVPAAAPISGTTTTRGGAAPEPPAGVA